MQCGEEKFNCEIEKWGDGQNANKFEDKVLDLKIENNKLQNKVEELEDVVEECRHREKKLNTKEGVRVLKSLNGDLSEYIRLADKDDIKYIESCCDMFLKGKYKCKDIKERLI